MTHLVLIRHGESVWNAKGIWTGLTDIPLSTKGQEESKNAGLLLKKIFAKQKFDVAYTSKLKRAKESLEIIKHVINQANLLTIENESLNERDYGEFTGKNKWEIKKLYGKKRFLEIRRGWDSRIKNGETLKDVYSRVVPYYKKEILPKLKVGKNILIVAHGNSLRALVKYLENISDEDISSLELNTGEIYLYNIKGNGRVSSKQTLSKTK